MSLSVLLTVLTSFPEVAKFAKQLSTYKKYLPIIRQVYEIVDPIIKSQFPSLSSSDLYRIVEKAIEDVTKGEVSGEELHELVLLVLDMFKVQKAADKPVSAS